MHLGPIEFFRLESNTESNEANDYYVIITTVIIM